MSALAGLALPVSAQDCPPGLEILAERGLAESVGLAPGDVVPLRTGPESTACDAVVAGVFEPPADPALLTQVRPGILLHLPHLQSLTGRADEVDYFTVRTRPDVDPEELAVRLEPLLPGAQALPADEVAEQSSLTFRVASRFQAAIAVLTLAAGGVFLACIMVLKVQERRRPIAAARLSGVPRGFLFWWTVAESALLAIVGGAAGIGFGVLSSWVVNAYYQRYYDTSLVFSRVTGEVALQAGLLALLLGLAAGVFAGARMVAADPLDETR